MPVRDVVRSIAFYVETLSFETVFRAADDSIALVRKGPINVQLLACSDEEVLKITATNIAVYIEIDGLDEFFEDLRPRLELLPTARVGGPINQPYGMREFHVKDPDGMLMFFGEDIPNWGQ